MCSMCSTSRTSLTTPVTRHRPDCSAIPVAYSSARLTTSDPSHRGAGVLAGAPRCLQDQAMSRAILATVFGLAAACASNHSVGPPPPDTTGAGAFLDTLEQRTFGFFWDLTNTTNGLTPDRWPTPSFSSIAAVGFALTAYPIGVERGYVSRAAAAGRVLTTLRFFWTATQDSSATATGYHGFFYHFLDINTGARYQTVELSTIDTALLLAGVLTCQSYFDGADTSEVAIR